MAEVMADEKSEEKRMDCPKCHKPSRIRSSNDTRKGWIERRECKTCGYRFVVEADGTTRTIRMYRQPDIKVEKTTLADWTPRERRARELLAETTTPALRARLLSSLADRQPANLGGAD